MSAAIKICGVRQGAPREPDWLAGVTVDRVFLELYQYEGSCRKSRSYLFRLLGPGSSEHRTDNIGVWAYPA